ncbi:MAG: hypothetical protein WC162_00155 [Sphaerochaetaceae bacterium]
MNYCDILEFRDKSLFNGAIDLDCFVRDPELSEEIACSYIFHGSKCHLGDDRDNKNITGQQLTDAITFASKVLESLFLQENKMILGIAGYGAGKSHFAIMLCNLLGSNIKIRDKILNNIRFVDEKEADKIKDSLNLDPRPVLVVPINGLRSFNLQEAFFKTTKKILLNDNQSIEFLNAFDTRFSNLKYTFVNHKNVLLINSILKDVGCKNIEEFIERMDNSDVDLFELILKNLKLKGEYIDISSSASGELKDLIPLIYKENCGNGKHYRSMIIVFDEFGKYMMFAAENETRAGSGIMQQLYEGVNSLKDSSISLLGLSQLDLKQYQVTTVSNSLNAENNKNRFVTRFDHARRYYLSVSLESLISNLIKVKKTEFLPNKYDKIFEKRVEKDLSLIHRWFPVSNNSVVWTDVSEFIKVIAIGCWPLDSFSLWLLVYLSSVNNILQERSSLNLLKQCFETLSTTKFDLTKLISATSFFEVGLGQEFENSEHSNPSINPIALKYQALMEKYGQQLTDKEIIVLRAIIISNKIKARCLNFDDSELLLSKLSLLSKVTINSVVKNLTENYNIIEESSNNLFDLITNAPSFSEYSRLFQGKINSGARINDMGRFKSMVKSLINNKDFEQEYNNLFKFVDTKFAVNHNIDSIEWKFLPELDVSDDPVGYMSNYLRNDNLFVKNQFNQPKGIILYLITNKLVDIVMSKQKIKDMLISKKNKTGFSLPLIIVIIPDSENKLFENAMKYYVLRNFSLEEEEKFKVFYNKDKRKIINATRETIDILLKKRIIIADVNTEYKRYSDYANQLFEIAFPKVISFEMAGFGTDSGKGYLECKNLILSLVKKGSSNMNFLNDLTVTQKTHCVRLIGSWCFFDFDKQIKKYPGNSTIKMLFENLDNELDSQKNLEVSKIFSLLQQPPFGLNSSGSSVLVFLYYAGRNNELEFIKGGESKDLSIYFNLKKIKWFDSSTKGLNKEFFKDCEFIKKVRNDLKCLELIENWRNAQTYKEKIEFNIKAKELFQVQHLVLPSDLTSVYGRLSEEAGKASEMVSKLENCKKEYSNDFISLMKTKALYQLANKIFDFKNKLEEIFQDQSNWLPEEKDKVSETFSSLQAYFEENLKDWVACNLLNCNTNSEQNMVLKCRVLCKKLDILKYKKSQTYLEKMLTIYEEKSKSLEIYNKVLFEVNQVFRKFDLQIQKLGIFNWVQAKQNVLDLENCMIMIKSLNNSVFVVLKKDKTELTSKVEKRLDYVKNIINQNDKYFNDIFDSKINKDSDLNELLDKANSLKAFYVNDEKASKIDSFIKEIRLINASISKLNMGFFSYSDFALKFNEICEEHMNVLKNPIIDDISFIEKEYNNKRNYWLIKGDEWTEKINTLFNNSKSTDDWNYIISMINNKPVFLSEFNKQRVDEIFKETKKYLNKKELEYIISLINNLDEENKKNLFEKLKNFL